VNEPWQNGAAFGSVLAPAGLFSVAASVAQHSSGQSVIDFNIAVLVIVIIVQL